MFPKKNIMNMHKYCMYLIIIARKINICACSHVLFWENFLLYNTKLCKLVGIRKQVSHITYFNINDVHVTLFCLHHNC